MIFLSERPDAYHPPRARSRAPGGLGSLMVAVASQIPDVRVDPWPLWLTPQSRSSVKKGRALVAEMHGRARRRL